MCSINRGAGGPDVPAITAFDEILVLADGLRSGSTSARLLAGAVIGFTWEPSREPPCCKLGPLECVGVYTVVVCWGL